MYLEIFFVWDRSIRVKFWVLSLFGAIFSIIIIIYLLSLTEYQILWQITYLHGYMCIHVLYEVGVFLNSCVHLARWAQREKIICPDYPASQQQRQNFHPNRSNLNLCSSKPSFCFSLGIWFRSWGGTRGKNVPPTVRRLHWPPNL